MFNFSLISFSDIKLPYSFSESRHFAKAFKQQYKSSLPIYKIVKVVESIPLYKLHVRTLTNFDRRHINIPDGAKLAICADIGYFTHYGTNKYFLLTVDYYSQFINVQPMANKNGESVKKALNKIIKEQNMFKLTTISTDEDKAFLVNKSYWLSLNITLLILKTEMKAFLAERYIGLFKNIMSKYLKTEKTQDWVSSLSSVVEHINNRPLKNLSYFSPASINSSVKDPYSRNKIVEKTSRKRLTKKEREFKVNDLVLVNLKHQLGQKAFGIKRILIYKIYEINKQKIPYLYRLKNLADKIIKRPYYAAELISNKDLRKNFRYPIIKVLDSRRYKNSNQFLVETADGNKKYVNEQNLLQF